MSDENTPIVTEVTPAAAESFLQRFRLHLLASAVISLVLIALLAGIAIGMAKRNFEKKFYLEQIVKLKLSLSESLEVREELAKEISGLKIELRAKTDHVKELDAKLGKLENNEQPSPSSEPEPLNSSGDAGVDYLRLKAGDCVVEGSGAATAAKWRECLNKAKKTPDSKH